MDFSFGMAAAIGALAIVAVALGIFGLGSLINWGWHRIGRWAAKPHVEIELQRQKKNAIEREEALLKCAETLNSNVLEHLRIAQAEHRNELLHVMQHVLSHQTNQVHGTCETVITGETANNNKMVSSELQTGSKLPWRRPPRLTTGLVAYSASSTNVQTAL